MLSTEVFYLIFKDKIVAAAREDSLKDYKNSELYTFIMLFLLLLILWGTIYSIYRTFMKTNFEQKHYFKMEIDGQEQKLIILKKVKKERVLCTIDSSSTTNDIIYIFLPLESISNTQIYKYSIRDVRNRRYERIYEEFTDAFQNKIALAVIIIVTFIFMGAIAFVSGKPLMIAIEVIVIFSIFIAYYSFNYRKGKKLHSKKKISEDKQDWFYVKLCL
ncbi:hypothetical protein BCR22_14030 [Enterococcus plantarum]|nr:hypothetical protein BCR22_14030 [Enterococcus plantarum]